MGILATVTTRSADTGFLVGYYLMCLVLCGVFIYCSWKLFVKAGIEGWKCLIPFYNTYLMFKIAFGNGWLFLLMFVPFANFIISILFMFKLAKAFGKGAGFGFGLLFLYPIFFPILALGDAEYVGANN